MFRTEPIHAQWIVCLNDHLQNKTDEVRKGFQPVVIAYMYCFHSDTDPKDPFSKLLLLSAQSAQYLSTAQGHSDRGENMQKMIYNDQACTRPVQKFHLK